MTTDSLAPVVRRINRERVVVLGWPRAILLQMAHPLIAAGVAEHSSFRDGPFASIHRLRETVRAMLGLTFGTAEEHTRVIEGIRAIHRRVNGRLARAVGRFPAGTPYSAEDPDLLLWVYVTLIDSTLLVYERVVGPTAPTERDDYCGVSARIALELGARTGDVPTDYAGLSRALANMMDSDVLAVGDDAMAIAGAILGGPIPRLAGPIGHAHRLLTSAWLPDRVRAQYGLPWGGAYARRAERVEGLVRRSRAILPRVVTEWRDGRNPRPLR